MRNLYKNGINTVKELAGKVFERVPTSVQRGILAGLVATGATAATQPAADALGLDDLVNNAYASRIVEGDIDASIPEETDLSEFKVAIYDLGNSKVGLRIYRDSGVWHVAADDQTEIRLKEDTYTFDDLIVGEGDSLYVDALTTIKQKSELIDKPFSPTNRFELPGSDPNKIDNLIEYMTFTNKFVPSQSTPWYDLTPTGTRIMYVSQSQDPDHILALSNFVANVNQAVPGLGNNVHLEIYSDNSPNTISNPLVRSDFIDGEAKVEPLPQGNGDYDYTTQTMMVDPAFVNDSTLFEEGWSFMNGVSNNTVSADSSSTQPIDVYNFRTTWMSPVDDLRWPGYGVSANLFNYFSPNFNEQGSGFPRELPLESLLAIVNVDADGHFKADLNTPTATTPTGKQATLYQNSPNPFNPSTTISYSVGPETPVKLSVYDIRGRLIDTVVDGVMPEGTYKVQWGGKDKFGNEVSSGVYFYQLETPGNKETKKMTLVK